MPYLVRETTVLWLSAKIMINHFHKEIKPMFSNQSREKQNPISMVKLKNGSEVPKPVLITTMMSLELLMNKNPIACYELVQKCKDSKHTMFGNTKKVVEDLALMNSGSIHDTVKDIVLSAVEGDELNMVLTSPIEKSSVTKKM